MFYKIGEDFAADARALRARDRANNEAFKADRISIEEWRAECAAIEHSAWLFVVGFAAVADVAEVA